MTVEWFNNLPEADKDRFRATAATRVWGAARLLFSRQETAHILNISVRSVDYLAAKGRLQTVNVGRRKFFKKDSLLNFAGNGIASKLGV